jgi:hypothetical protein
VITINESEALQLLDNAVAQLQTNRQTHVQLQQAVEVLKLAIQPKTEEKEEKK